LQWYCGSHHSQDRTWGSVIVTVIASNKLQQKRAPR
jgi:hypothetical protein